MIKKYYLKFIILLLSFFSCERELSKKKYLGLTMIHPNLELQNQFIDRVQAIEVQKAQAQASLLQAEDLFNSLLQKAFKGELV